ncbi:MAG TPA: hypothetical protein PLL78_09545 [Fimbriimonadaceae bacterium]|nr:hypothetical protein [Fimbriimonadaceae bacterium]HRJ96918.1 hypothetical protein [Fimbriimonadaceae bacterium]
MIRNLARCLAATAIAATVGTAWAIDYDAVTFVDIEPVQTTDYSLGTLNTHVFTVGGYNLGRIKFSGTLEEINGTTADFGTENRIQVMYPDGRFKNVQLSNTTSYTGVLAINGGFFLAVGAAAPFGGGTWEFRYINTLDDSPAGGVPDAKCTITFTLSDEAPPTPPASTNLGVIATGGETDPTPALTHTDNHNAGDIRWYRIQIQEAVAGTKYLDIDTEDTTAFLTGNDTEIAVYDQWGGLIATDDDDGSSLLSQLSFGPDAGTRPLIGTSVTRNGRDGSLSSGVYYVAVSGFNAVFSDDFAVTTTSTRSGPVVLNFRTNLSGSALVSGNVTLEGRDAGTEVGQQVVIEIRNVGSTTPIHTEMVTLGLNGAYSFNLPGSVTPGNYDIAAKHSKSLRKNMGNQTITGSGISGLNFSLVGGDCDDDNEITIGDYALISTAFNTCFPDAGYDDRADCTGDTCVDIGDFAVMSQNFGMLGDD